MPAINESIANIIMKGIQPVNNSINRAAISELLARPKRYYSTVNFETIPMGIQDQTTRRTIERAPKKRDQKWSGAQRSVYARRKG